MIIETTNPATGELGTSFIGTTAKETFEILEAAQNAQITWAARNLKERAAVALNAVAVLENDCEALANQMAVEMGKPISQGRAEIRKCAELCRFYAENAGHFLSDETIPTDATNSYIKYVPLGVVLAVMPWNFPFWQVFRFAIPTLLAGNAGILKHASNVPGCALAVESVLHTAGFPKELFRTLLVDSGAVAGLINTSQIKAVTLTGSTPAGRSVAAEAGRALKKTVLELGGNDPYLILEDADLEAAAEACVAGRTLNSGQSCIAAKRWIVVDAVADEFTELVLALMRSKRVGDPLDEETEIGPLARADLRDELHAQVVASRDAGAELLLGGEIPPTKGAWYPPTILNNVTPKTPAYHEELFGPVASIIRVDTVADAIEVANDSKFGLGAAVFTRNIGRGEEIAANQLNAGSCFVNTFVRSDQRLPFGGILESGYGRELGAAGMREFVNTKTVYIA